MSKINNSLYIYLDEIKLFVVNRREELTLISPVGRDYLKKQNYTYIHMRRIVIGILSQAREGLDTKAHLYLYDNRFYDHKQTQIVNAEAYLKNKLTIVGYIPNIDIDINEFCEHIKLSVQTKGYKMKVEYKNLKIKKFSRKII